MAKSDIQMFRARTSEVEIEFMDDQIQNFDSERTFWNYDLFNRRLRSVAIMAFWTKKLTSSIKWPISKKFPFSTFESMFEKILKWNFVFMGRRLRKFSLRLRKLRLRENWIRIELESNLTLILLTKILFWKFYNLDI